MSNDWSLSPTDVFVLLDDGQAGDDACSLLFLGPVQHIACTDVEGVPAAFAALEAGCRQGLYAAGYFAFEMAEALVPKPAYTRLCHPVSAPLLDFYLFRRRLPLNAAEVDRLLHALADPALPPAVLELRLNKDSARYREDIARIHAFQRAGHTYQVNHTLKYRFRHAGDPVRLYAALKARQRVAYGAFLNFPEQRVLSLSPELFFRKQGERLVSKPMKGTAPRGGSEREDAALAQGLAADPKTRAENLIIVDLIRNDFGRVCRPGSVRAGPLFQTERYQTLWQMTSTVTGQLDADTPLSKVLRALFPCGSITGAPKVRTLGLIRELEGEPRGVYTGAIGHWGPDNDGCFNVAIRTCVLHPDGSGELGVGGGITYDSDPEREYEECLLKGRFLGAVNAGFTLFESLLYDGDNGRYPHLARHLARLSASCAVFGFAFDQARATALLVETGEDRGLHKVKLSVHANGRLEIAKTAIAAPPPRPWVIVAAQSIRSDNLFQYHKSNHRQAYDAIGAELARCDLYDAIFLNERGEVAEASRHNVIIERDGRWFTPPVSAGILNGVMRQILLEQGRHDIREAVLYPEDLRRADRVLLVNSVRGIVEVTLVDDAAPDQPWQAAVCSRVS
jgi:para-aminobenzoate synthetase/4-amino-4-deoxychorismate lyase